MAENLSTDELTERQIADYLTRHPNFFAAHLELLDRLTLVHPHKGTLSLVEMQLERQRNRIKELEAELSIFARLAQQDQAIFLALMPLQQQLSTCTNLAQGIEALNQWAKRWELQQAKILLFNDAWQKHPSLAPSYWLDRKAFELIRLERFGLRRFYLGQLTGREKALLFLPEEYPIGSVACCLLGAKTGGKSTALLLFSARDGRHFHNGQDTMFLQHLVNIVELHLTRWLANYTENL
ncbi:DUF484 family protein [Caviibacterium pharyngocola]|uniref:DUF484 family protein n=1 Tax=Caviibacterium pharyngocola TaxID=28159 RepID=A0A2M8RXH9_9PAST|nr:DUF484 family protein [Caviibacterium pharyngocola]PJG83593.1 DUF484 family protein [Caviibacterium pharyngocola]